MPTTPQTLKGFRDFLPAEKRARDYVATKVKEVFERFGFEPIETPTLEYSNLLLGKYGTEADKLVYTFEDRGGRNIGLRYDQTVPSARVLTQYQNVLPKYFRRYQIQNVFRADKPQKGRYREFTQCDIDIFGSTSPMADAEIIACTYAAFKHVGFPTVILKLNDRRTLFDTLSPFATATVDVFSIIQSLDKLDKLPEETVISELSEKGLGLATTQAILAAIKQAPVSENLSQIITLSQALGVDAAALQVAPTLARGLDYYTGMIFEIIVPEYPIGSFGGGGRYNNLIKQLGGPNVPAVGVAFGFDRMVEGAQALHLTNDATTSTQVLVTVFDESSQEDAASIGCKLRQSGIITEVYPAIEKLGKQLKYADQKHIPLAVMRGPEEIKQGSVTIKNLVTGEQKTAILTQLVASITELL